MKLLDPAREWRHGRAMAHGTDGQPVWPLPDLVITPDQSGGYEISAHVPVAFNSFRYVTWEIMGLDFELDYWFHMWRQDPEAVLLRKGFEIKAFGQTPSRVLSRAKPGVEIDAAALGF